MASRNNGVSSVEADAIIGGLGGMGIGIFYAIRLYREKKIRVYEREHSSRISHTIHLGKAVLLLGRGVILFISAMILALGL